MIYKITPVAKPRITHQGRFKPVVKRYYAFAEECRLRQLHIPEAGAHVTFYMPMPKSWSKKKKQDMNGQAHQQKPDVDNLLKSVLDSIYEDDAGVWDIRVTKYWSTEGAISVKSGA